MKQLIVILGSSTASNLGLARCLFDANCEVVVVCNAKYKNKHHPEERSRYIKQFLCLDPMKEEETVAYLKEHFGNQDNKTILIPTSDIAADFLDKCYNLLASHFLLPSLDHSVCNAEQITNKSFQKELARSVGFDVLGAWYVDTREDVISIPDNVEYPCFVKGVMSMSPKRYLKKCEDRNALQSHLNYIKKNWAWPMMIEQYAQIEKEYGFVAICNGQNVAIPALVELAIVGKGPLPGVSIQGIVRPFDVQSDLYRKAVRFLQKLNMVGICNVDLFEMGGKIYFSEVNIRYCAYCYAVSQAGVNLPAMLVDILKGENLPSPLHKCKQIKYFNEYIAFNDISVKKLTYTEAKKIRRNSDICLIYRQDDPEPYRKFRQDCIKTVALNYLHSLKIKIHRCLGK